MYELTWHIHVSAVVVSIFLFVLRSVWMLSAPHWLDQRWVRVVPHVVDTALLASAITLAVIIRQYPFVQAWLTAKVLALVVYIVAGSIALKRGRTLSVRIIALVIAVLTVSYIVWVARAHSPWPVG